MLLGGVDRKGSRLFWTDPSGAFLAYKAWAIGAGGDGANEILEAEYKDNMGLEDAILLALKCMNKVLEEKLDAQKIRLATVPASSRRFTKLSQEEVEKHLKRLDSSKKAVNR
jgi:proteasome alpha subunit